MEDIHVAGDLQFQFDKMLCRRSPIKAEGVDVLDLPFG